MKRRFLVIDDEKPARDRVKRLLEAHPDFELAGEAADAEAAVRLIDGTRPDLCFLDVQMPEGTGFDVLQRVRHVPQIIFVTAYDHYAVPAFEVRSIDYLLKPVGRERFAQALERARERIDGAGSARRILDELDALRQLVGEGRAATAPRLGRVSARSGSGILLLDPDEIVWFETEDALVFARTAAGRFLVDQSLAKLERQLEGRFFRAHRSCLVNLGRIAEIRPAEAGTYTIVCAGSGAVPLSRRRARRLREIFPWVRTAGQRRFPTADGPSATAHRNPVALSGSMTAPSTTGGRHMACRMSIALILAVAFAGAPTPAAAQRAEAGAVVTVPSGEVREGDLYATGETIRVDGRLAGDLVAGAQRVLVRGEVDGDLFAAGRTVDLLGPVGDSTRVAGEHITVDAVINGDLIAAGNRLQLLDGAVIRGGLMTASSTVELEGMVEEDFRAAAGEVIVRGTVRGDAYVIADRLELAPGARIDGDLDYRTRIPLSAEEAARVGGTVRHGEPVDDEDSDGSWVGSILFWGWQTGAALLAGLLAVALFRGGVQQLVSAIAGQPTLGALLGFGAFLIVPVAAVVVMVTVVGLPLGMIVMLLFGMALYVAKLPMAVWAGGRLLALVGRPDASPYAAMAAGVLMLYLLFATPWLGGLFWLAATWLGLGAMVLSGRRYLSAETGWAG